MTAVPKQKSLDRRRSHGTTKDLKNRLSSSSVSKTDCLSPRASSAKVQKDKHSPTTSWSPAKNGFLAIPLKKPISQSADHHIFAYTQYIGALAGDVHDKCEQSVASDNGVPGLDWRIKEVLEDGSSIQQQLHGRASLDAISASSASNNADITSADISTANPRQST